MYWQPYHMGYYGWGGFGFLGGLISFLFWIFVVVIVFRLLRHHRHFQDHDNSALDILKQRYAKGEIDKKQFEEMKKDLQ